MLQAPGGPACGSNDDFEKMLAWHSGKQLKKLDVVSVQADSFILSGSRDFCFKGLCLLRRLASDQIGKKLLEEQEREVEREMLLSAMWRGKRDSMQNERWEQLEKKWKKEREKVKLWEKVPDERREEKWKVLVELLMKWEGLENVLGMRWGELPEKLLEKLLKEWEALEERSNKLEGQLKDEALDPTRLRLK